MKKHISYLSKSMLIMASVSMLPLESYAEVVLEEVVVTARKRGAESLQNIGGSIQAIGGESLANRSAIKFDDYSRTVPGLSANNSGSGQTQLSMRGVTATRLNHANPNVPSTVGLYFDESPIATSGFNPDAGLIDIDRIEVLRGPQGTLFGASAMAGMIRIIPKAPDLEEFSVEGGMTTFFTKSGDASYAGHGIVNIPVAENFAVRLVGFNFSNGGYIDNVYAFGDTGENYNDENIFGGRATALWLPSEKLTIKGTLTYQNTAANGRPDEFVPGDPEAGVGLVTGSNLLLSNETLSQFQVSEELQTSKFLADTFDDETWTAAFQADFDLNENVQITSVTSYFGRTFNNVLDDTIRFRDIFLSVGANCAVGTGACLGAALEVPVAAVALINDTEMNRFGQDLRSSFSVNDNISGVVGAYYERENRTFLQDIPIPGLDAWHEFGGGDLGGFLPLSLADSAEGPDNAFDGIFDVSTRQISLYGEVSVQLGDVEVTGGLRYFDYKQDALIHWVGWAEFGDDLLEDTITGNGINPMAEITYQASEDILLYARAAKGFRLGSVQQFVNEGFCGADLAALGVDEAPTTIENDSLWNYEAGVKSTLFDGTTTVNASVYHIDWKDARTQVFMPCGWIVEFPTQIVSEGFELEIASKVSENLLINLAVGYNNSRLSEDAASIGAFKGDATPFSPEWTVSSGFDYQVPDAFKGVDGFVRGDISYIGSQLSELGSGSLPRHELPSSTVINLYTGFETDQWQFTVFAKNLTNERIVTGADVDRRLPVHFSRGRPLSIGMTVRFFM